MKHLCCLALLCGFSVACVTTNRPDGGVGGRGLGEPCSSNVECRVGLICGMGGTCQSAGTTAEHMPCQITADCAGTLHCARSGTCEASGDTLPGGTCADTASCIRGAVCFRGDPPGLYGVCRVPRGATVMLADGGVLNDDAGVGGGDGGAGGDGGTMGADGGAGGGRARDIGGNCANLLDCIAGLACNSSTHTCQPGVAGMGLPAPWPGATCPSEAGDGGTSRVRSYFEVPAADGTPRNDFFRLPFPNDIRRGTDGHPNLRGFPTPGTAVLPFDIVDRYARAVERDTDGFGTNQTVFFRFSGGIDFNSLRLGETVRLIDLTTGMPTNSIRYSANTAGNRYLCANYLTVETGAGYPMEPGHTYAAILTTGINDAPPMGQTAMPVVRDADFNAMMGASPPSDPNLARAYMAYAPLRRYVMMQGLNPDTILNAAVFTTSQPRRVVSQLRDVVRAQPAPMPMGFVRCDTGVRSPCDDGLSGDAHVRGCLGAANPAFDELQGQIEVPVMQRGTRPYNTLGEGSIETNAMGVPMVQRTERVCVTITIPRGTTMPMNGWPVVIYAHGTGGNFRSVITEGLAERIANIDLGGGMTARVATIGYEGVMHGARRGDAVTDPPDVLFFNFANPQAARDNVIQGAADVFALVRAAEGMTLPMLPAMTDTTRFDPRNIVFFGHSQGATVGMPAAAYETSLRAVVLSGAGGDLRVSLTTKRHPVDIASLTPFVLGELTADAGHPAVNLFQAFIEPADAVNYGRLFYAQRVMGVSLRSVLQTYGLRDTFSTNGTMQAVATSIGLPAAGNIPGGMMAWPGGMPLALPVMGNIRQGMETATAALIEADPSGYDGHFVTFRDMTIHRQVLQFIGTSTMGVPAVR